MHAAVMRHNRLTVEDLPLAEPGAGEVLVKTLACGICGSDLHALKHTRELVERVARSVAPLITAKVAVEGVAAAFEALVSPATHAKILLEPWHA